jgi:chromosomal replication initiation ATPase DnaA
MQLNKQRKIVLIFGKTGTGKSHLANKIIRDFPRTVIIDPKHEYTNGLIFYSFELFVKYILENDFISDINKNFNFICRFSDESENEAMFEICEVLENLCLLIDEIEFYIESRNKSTYFNNLINYGRHHNISIIGIARRPAEMSTTLKSQVDTIYSFQMTLPSDIKYLENFGLSNVETLPLYRDTPNLPHEQYYSVVEY